MALILRGNPSFRRLLDEHARPEVRHGWFLDKLPDGCQRAQREKGV